MLMNIINITIELVGIKLKDKMDSFLIGTTIVLSTNSLILPILDDMVDTAGTLTQAAMALKERGAHKIHACCTHAILSGPAIERIDASPINSLVITNTIPLTDTAKGCQKTVVLSIAELLGETIKRSHSSHSVSTLFV